MAASGNAFAVPGVARLLRSFAAWVLGGPEPALLPGAPVLLEPEAILTALQPPGGLSRRR